MTIEVRRSVEPAEVLDVARDHLSSRPVEHNLILTLLWARVLSPEPGRYWMVVGADEVVGVAFQSPIDYVLTATPMESGAIDALVAAVVDDGGAVPGVQAEAATAARIAGAWTEHKGTAAVPRVGMRIYTLEDLVPPLGVPGELRTASLDDLDVVLEMLEGFHRDTGEASVVQPGVHEERVASGAYVLWWDGERPCALSASSPPLEGMSRVYAVYTPPDLRRRGYAGAAVAALSARIRDGGADAMLFTDLGNPVSNSVYRRIGYRAVAENLRYDFT